MRSESSLVSCPAQPFMPPAENVGLDLDFVSQKHVQHAQTYLKVFVVPRKPDLADYMQLGCIPRISIMLLLGSKGEDRDYEHLVL